MKRLDYKIVLDMELDRLLYIRQRHSWDYWSIANRFSGLLNVQLKDWML